MALIASRPPSQPLYHFYQHARSTKPVAHKSPLHAYFRSPTADIFKAFEEIQQPDPSVPLPMTPNFKTLILPDKEKAIKAIQVLRPSNAQVVVYLEGSRIEGKNTAAAAWCANNKHLSSEQLGKANKYGIFEAEFVGFILALRLARNSILPTTRQITIVLDNQSVVKDMSHKKTSSSALTHKTTATKMINKIRVVAPSTKIALR